MDSLYDAVFETLTAEVMDTLPPDRWAVARIVTCLIQTDPYHWPALAGGTGVREARLGCCRMRYTVTGGTVEIQGIGWSELHVDLGGRETLREGAGRTGGHVVGMRRLLSAIRRPSAYSG